MASKQMESIATAAVLVGLLAVPTASQNIEYSQQRISDTPIASTETSSTDIDVNIDPEDPSTVEIEKHNMVYTVKEKPTQRTEQIRTPEGTLTLIRNNNSRISKLSTPYGELVKGVKNGRTVKKFSGENRTETEKIMNNLNKRAEEYREKARQKILPDLQIRITKSKATDEDERARIENEESSSVDITGWTVVNSDGDTYTFDDFTVPPRGDLLIYTASESDLNVTENNQTRYIYGTGTDWDGGSEEAALFNVEGVKIDEDSY